MSLNLAPARNTETSRPRAGFFAPGVHLAAFQNCEALPREIVKTRRYNFGRDAPKTK